MLRNQGSQQRLWAQGVSGDWPILLATIESAEGLPTLRQLFSAHRYWRRRGMTVDLVVMIAQPAQLSPGADRPDHGSDVRGRATSAMADRPGGVFIRRQRPCSGRRICSCCGRRRGCTSPATAGRCSRIVDARPRSRKPIELEEQEPTPSRPRSGARCRSASVVQRLRARARPASIAPFTCRPCDAAPALPGRSADGAATLAALSATTGSAGSPPMATTRSGSRATGCPRAVGERDRQSAGRLPRHRARGRVRPGRRTASSSGSRPGTTTR